MFNPDSDRHTLKFPANSMWGLYFKNANRAVGAEVEFANDGNRFFKVPLGTVDVNAPNSPEWETIASSDGVNLIRDDQQFYTIHLERGGGNHPVIIENPANPDKRDEAGVMWIIDHDKQAVLVATETEFPTQFDEGRIYPQTRLTRRSVNNPKPDEVFGPNYHPVRLGENIHLHPGLILSGVDFSTIVANGAKFEDHASMPWYKVAETYDGVGQAVLGLALVEACKNPDFAHLINSAIFFHLANLPTTPKPATLSQDMRTIGAAAYTVSIESIVGTTYYNTNVAGSAFLSAGYYPRGDVKNNKGYIAPGLQIHGLASTLPVAIEKGRFSIITDDSGRAIDASEISEEYASYTQRRSYELGEVLTNSQRIVGATGTNVQQIENPPTSLHRADIPNITATDNAPLLAALFRLISKSVMNPLNPYREQVNLALFHSLVDKTQN